MSFIFRMVISVRLPCHRVFQFSLTSVSVVLIPDGKPEHLKEIIST
jgi:hypothetical protein